jgi:hypothetical protein
VAEKVLIELSCIFLPDFSRDWAKNPIICIKENLEISEHKRNVQTKVMTTMFSLFA